MRATILRRCGHPLGRNGRHAALSGVPVLHFRLIRLPLSPIRKRERGEARAMPRRARGNPRSARPTGEVALHLVASLTRLEGELLLRLDPFGHDRSGRGRASPITARTIAADCGLVHRLVMKERSILISSKGKACR